MKIKYYILLIFILFIELSYCDTVTQEGTDAGNFLKLETGIRGIGMGGAHVASARNIGSIGYNPAGISFTKGSDLYCAYRSYLVGITIGSIGFARQLSSTNFLGFHLFYLDSGDIERTTLDFPDGGLGYYKVQDLVFSTVFSKMLTDRLRLGINFKYIREDIWETAFSTVAMDVGSIFDTGIYGMILGMSVSNFAPEIQFHGEGLKSGEDESTNEQQLWSTGKYNLPLIFRMGVAKELIGSKSDLMVDNTNALVMEINSVSPSDAKMYGSVGFEYSWNNILYLRTGKYINHDTASFTFGGGLDYELSRYKFSINYAYSNYSILDNTHQFGINFGF